MVLLDRVVKRYPGRRGPVTILNGVDLLIRPGEKVGILGRNGAGKSTMIRLISGVESPSAGRIVRQMSVSWPLAFGGAFQGSLTGLDNLRFICRVYGVSWEDRIPFVQDFAELGRSFREPVKTYSAGMMARLAFALSMAIEFDCFLIDEVIAVGDARFHEKCERELFEKRADRALIMVSHDGHSIRQHCDRACVLRDGKLYDFPDVESAYTFYHAGEGAS
ncbi:ABC transporter ATP-binding protein [Piscinibacter sakaiensis]|uniref:Capsular polysaccharide ABC transporter, ATP-binding protein KpsT n=1 Tax=Piscinibacter sakaiensis TaxID=1547922 RepID=A0A0K8NY19_PISS1|nr:ABC transporter ATP-binding protein [Piscinibacter sakaiensis]GAP35174.1 capsular polysaccharide ABC transporter, ATP-binding protein KpsT [Piscinibacter sakaiensis]